ncbi:MAG: tyrosine-type recombinase/integrase [Alphaproteobacteria bacterium]|nr:tyrosine-type recombinase/integrase [Alphaproteobacteria bacterium]
MVNQVFIDDKKIKDILTYISGMRHAEQIRMMFLCSLNGMRSINFAYLQVADVYTPDLKVKDVICLDSDKNKGKFGCSYYLNSQMKKEFKEYLVYLKSRNEEITPETYLFTSQKLGKPFNRVSISRIFSTIYKKFNIEGASHLGRHLFVSRLINAGTNICLVQKLANHRNIATTQRYFNYNETMLSNAVENVVV